MAVNRIIKRGTDKRLALVLTSYDQLERKRLLFERPMWVEIAQYEHPMINNFQDDNQQGKKRTNYILDSHTQLAIKTASKGYQAYLFPRSAPWFKYGLDQEELERKKENAMWLERIEKAMYAELARSEFYQEAGKMMPVGLTIATASMYVEDHPDARCSEYLALHPKEAYIARNRYGLVDTLYRRYLMTGRNILDEFGDSIEEYVKKPTLQSLEKNPHKAVPVIHAVFPRKDKWAAKLFTAKDYPWASLYILEDEQVFLRESGFPEFPYAVWCYDVNTDEDYGRGPGWDCLPDTKRLQVVVKSESQAIQTGAKSPTFYPEELDDVLDLGPGGKIPYRDFMRKVAPIETSTINLQHVSAVAERIRQQIDDHYDVPFFLIFSQRERLEKTATEIAEIAGERAALMSTTTGRIESDWLDPIHQLSLRNAARAGRLPPPPPALRASGAELKIKYIGPMANLQKRYHGQQNMYTTFAQAVPWLQVFPEARAVINPTASVRKLLREGGYPAEGLNDERETEAQVEQIRQAQAQAQAAEMVGTLGKAAPGLIEQEAGRFAGTVPERPTR